MIAGSFYYKKERAEERAVEAVVAERKGEEKRAAWIRELEIRDREDREVCFFSVLFSGGAGGWERRHREGEGCGLTVCGGGWIDGGTGKEACGAEEGGYGCGGGDEGQRIGADSSGCDAEVTRKKKRKKKRNWILYILIDRPAPPLSGHSSLIL